MARFGFVLLALAGMMLAVLLTREAERERMAPLLGENARLQREVDALAKSAKWSEGQLLAAGRRLADATARASGATRHSEEQSRALQAVAVELADLRLVRDRAEAERAQMAGELEQTQARSQRSIDDYAGESARLALELDQLRARMAAAGEALGEAETRHARDRQQLEQGAAAQAASLREAGAELAVLRGELAHAQSLADDLRAQHSRAETIADGLRAQLQAQQALVEGAVSGAEVEQLEQALAQATRERDAAVTRQREQRAWIDTQAAAVAVLEERLATVDRARLAAEQSLVARDAKLLERVAILDKGLAGATRSLATLDAENTRLASELSAAQEQLAGSAASHLRLEAALAGAQAAREQVRSELAASVAERAATREQLAASVLERDAAREELAATVVERDAVREELVATVVERDRLRARLETITASKGTLEQRLASTAGELQSAQSHAATLTAGYERLLAHSAQLSSLSDTQRAEMERARRALEDAQQEVARLSGARGIYTVQNGDSLSSIARFFYRNGNLWSKVMRANAHLIGSDPDLIFAGMVLIVPH